MSTEVDMLRALGPLREEGFSCSDPPSRPDVFAAPSVFQLSAGNERIPGCRKIVGEILHGKISVQRGDHRW